MQIPPSFSVLEALSRHVAPANGGAPRPAPVKPQPPTTAAARTQPLTATNARLAVAAQPQPGANKPVAISHLPTVPRGSLLNILV